MKEWKRSVAHRTFFKQNFHSGEIIAVDSYFYPDDVCYYASENGITLERLPSTKTPEEYKNTATYLCYIVISTKFQIPTYTKMKPIEVPLAEIL